MSPDAAEQLAMIVVMPVFFLMIGWIFKMGYQNARQKRMTALQTELHRRLLEKFDSTTDLVEFMNSDAGRRFSEYELTEPTSPYSKVLGSVQVGIILSLASIGILVIDRTIDVGGEGLVIPGVLGLTIGIGFLLSAVVSYRLSKAWGLINGHDRSPDGRE